MLFSFLLLKNNKKPDKFCMKFSPKSNVSMHRCYIPYFFYTPSPPPHSSSNAPPGSIMTPQETMTWNLRLSIFHMICNFFKCDDFTVS